MVNIGGALSVISGIGGIFGGGPSASDIASRNNKNLELYRLALAGDVKAEVQLRCLAGINDPRVVQYGIQSTATNCGWKYEESRAHARGLLAELDRQRLTVGSKAAPAPHPSSPAGQAIADAMKSGAGWFPVALLLGGGLVLYQASRQGAGRR